MMIQFKDVSKSYADTKAIEHLDLTIKKGEFLTIIGSSGGGKTTLIKMINGLLKPDSGSVYVNGENISNTNLIELRRKIGYAIQSVELFPHMTVAKNIAYVPSLSRKWSKDIISEKVELLLETVGLNASFSKRYPSELSGGQRQRIGIARAIASEPEILLMDEPFGAVDEITRRALQDEIIKIWKKLGVTVVFVTHDIHEALKLGSRVLVVDKGKMAQVDTPDVLRNQPTTDYVRQLINGV